MDRRALLMAGPAALATGLFAGPARAQADTVRFIYPYAAGSGGDTMLRVLADEVASKLGVTTLVENRTGADGRIGVRDVKMAAPDGRTLLYTPFAAMTLFPSVYANLPYDAFKDFAPVTQLTTFDFGLAVGPMAPVKSLAELVAWVKQNPDKANIGVPGLGALPHLLPLKFASLAGITFQAISYKGTVPALTEAMAGHIPLVCAPLSDLLEQHRAGTVHLLAASGHQRSPFAPDVPTYIEQGFDVEGSGWYAVFAPAGTPRPIIDRFNAVLVAGVRSAAGQARARQLWLNPTGTTPEELGAIHRADFERWAPVVAASGFHGI